VLFGREPGLGVDDPVVGEIESRLRGDSREPVLRLHHRAGLGERLQVAQQRLRGRGLDEPPVQRLDVGRRQPAVSGLRRELHDRRGPQSAVQMVVQGDLRQPPQRVEVHEGTPYARRVAQAAADSTLTSRRCFTPYPAGSRPSASMRSGHRLQRGLVTQHFFLGLFCLRAFKAFFDFLPMPWGSLAR
jgi:hypothetical protein